MLSMIILNSIFIIMIAQSIFIFFNLLASLSSSSSFFLLLHSISIHLIELNNAKHLWRLFEKPYRVRKTTFRINYCRCLIKWKVYNNNQIGKLSKTTPKTIKNNYKKIENIENNTMIIICLIDGIKRVNLTFFMC